MATPTTGSNATYTIADAAEYVPEIWSREIQQPFDKMLQAAKLVNDRSGLVSAGGDVVHIPFAAPVNARAKADGTAVTYDVPNGAPVSYNIDKKYYVGVLIEDIAQVQATPDLKSAFQTRMAEALARQIDTDLMNQYANVGTTVTGGANITDANILSVVSTFDAANTPSSQRVGIIGHNTKTDLLGINKYVAYDQTGKTGKAVDGSEDLTGSVYGIDLYHSGNVQTASTLGHNLFFHKSAVSLAKQLAPTFKMEYSVDYIGWKTVLYCVYGVGVERAASLIDLTRPTAP